MDDVEQVLMMIELVESAGIQCPLNEIEPRCLHFSQSLIDDVVELLKKQVPVEPEIYNATADTWYYICRICEMPISPGDRYCRGCGKPVKWKQCPAL